MKQAAISLHTTTLLITILSLSACNILPNDNDGNKNVVMPPLLEENLNTNNIVTYKGAATKGPITGATISVYAIDDTGLKTGEVLAQTTSLDGLWTLNVNNIDNDILLVESAGGTYIDESDPETDINKKRKLTLAANETLYGVLIPGETTAAINFLTHSLVKMFQTETSKASDVNQAFNRVRSRAYNSLLFDPFTLLPTDPINPDTAASDNAKMYALLIGGGAYMMNSASMLIDDPNISYTAIDMITADFSDCKIDGSINGQGLDTLYALSATLFDTINLKDEVLRFRNNHYEKYSNTALPNLDDILLCDPAPQISIALPSELIGLSVSSGSLAPAFSTFTHNYSLTVPWSSSTIDITPIADTVGTQIDFSTQTINSGQTASGISLAIGSNIITLQVIAEDGELQDNYILSINRDDQMTLNSVVDGGIKTLALNWSAVSNADTYRVLLEPRSGSGFTQVGSDTALTSHTIPLATHLFDWTSASLIVEAYGNGGLTLLNSSSAYQLTAGDMLGSIGYIKASNPASSTYFGQDVVISADGTTMAIGSHYESTGNSASGAVYVFKKSGSTWEEETKLKASDMAINDYFGASVDLSADGNTLVVGAYGVADDPAKSSNWNQGAVYIFQRTTGIWGNEIKLRQTNYQTDDHFGVAIAISADGETLAVAETGDDVLASDSGSAHIFAFNGSSWNHQDELRPSNGAINFSFGSSLDINANGDTLIVGAPGENSTTQAINSTPNSSGSGVGAAYIFTRDGVDVWSQQTYLKAFNSQNSDNYGKAVAISDDGFTVVIGAPNEDSNTTGINSTSSDNLSTDNYGAAYTYTWDSSTWTQQAYVKAITSSMGDFFGSSVALNNSGTILAVGAIQEDGSAEGVNGIVDESSLATGAAYVYKIDGGNWTEINYIKAKNTSSSDEFGGNVSLDGSGNTLIISAYKEAGSSPGVDGVVNNSFGNSGAVYIY